MSSSVTSSNSERLKQEVEATREELLKELAEEKARHQKLLQDYNRLEQRCENLKEDLEAAQHPAQQYVHHVRTDSSEGGESGYGTLSTNQVEDVESVENDIQVIVTPPPSLLIPGFSSFTS